MLRLYKTDDEKVWTTSLLVDEFYWWREGLSPRPTPFPIQDL